MNRSISRRVSPISLPTYRLEVAYFRYIVTFARQNFLLIQAKSGIKEAARVHGVSLTVTDVVIQRALNRAFRNESRFGSDDRLLHGLGWDRLS